MTPGARRPWSRWGWRGRLALVLLLLAGCGPERPPWLGRPPASAWSAVGVAPIRDGDVGAAEALAVARARKALAERLETEVEARLEHVVEERRRDAETQERQRTRAEVRTRSGARLLETRLVERYVDADAGQVYVLVAVDAEALARRVAERVEPWRRRWLALEAELAGQGPLADAAALVGRFVALWRTRPHPDAASRLLQQVDPDRARRLLGGLPGSEAGRAWLAELARRAAVRLLPEGTPRRGAALVVRIAHRAPGLPVRWRLRPRLPFAAPERLPATEGQVRLTHLLPGRDGAVELSVAVALPPDLEAELAAPPLARWRHELPGPPATLLLGGTPGCLEAAALARLVATCPGLADFERRELAVAAPELARRLERLGAGAARLGDLEAKLARAGADRLLWYRATCQGPTRRDLDGYTFYGGGLELELLDLWRDGTLERTQLAVETAAASPERWHTGLLEALGSRLCPALAGTEAP